MIIRIIKLLISILFWIFDIFISWIAKIFKKQKPGTCVILFYHSILPKHREKFYQQMDLFLKLSTAVSIEHEEALNSGIRYGSVTFDDGYVCLIDNAIPGLVKRNIPFTIFIPTAYLNDKPQWRKNYQDYSKQYNIFSHEQLKKISEIKQASIGSHSISHPYFTALSDEEAKTELVDSKRTLEQILDIKIDLFSFPHGSFNEKHISLAKEAGYKRIFSTLPVPTRFGSKEFIVGRTLADPTDWNIEFRLKLLGAYSWLPLAFRLKKWIKSGIKKNNLSR